MSGQFSAPKENQNMADKMSVQHNNMRHSSSDSLQEDKGQYSRKAFNNLQKLHLQSVDVKRIVTILKKFTNRHFIEIAVAVLCLFALKFIFSLLVTTKAIKASAAFMFLSSAGGAFIASLVTSLLALIMSKKLLLSPAERNQTSAFQGALTFVTFAASMSFLSFLFAFGMQILHQHDSGIVSLLIMCCMTVMASAVMSMFIVQYGLILPAAAANRKRSMAIACQQVRPFWKSLFTITFTAKAVMAFLAMIVLAVTQSYFAVSLIIGFISTAVTLYIYLSLSASYAAAGYLFNTDFDIQKDDFSTV